MRIEPPRIGAERHHAHAVGLRDRRARGGAAGHAAGLAVPGILRRAVVRVEADPAESELHHVGATDEHRTRRAQPRRRPRSRLSSLADFSRILEPARVTSPATSKRSLSETGRPSTGERRTPCLAQPVRIIRRLARRRRHTPCRKARDAFAGRIGDARERLLDQIAARWFFPPARSAASCATVHMRRKDSMRARLASLLFGGSCFLCRGAARGAAVRRVRRRAAAPRGRRCARAARCLRRAARSAAAASPSRRTTMPPWPPSPTPFPPTCWCRRSSSAASWRWRRCLVVFFLQRSLQRVDLIIPVPLSRQRLSERGYNQAVEIARHLRPRKASRLCLRAQPRHRAAARTCPSTSAVATCAAHFRCTTQLGWRRASPWSTT